MAPERTPNRSATLRLGGSVPALWKHLGLPWLKQQQQTAWQSAMPVAVLVPDRTAAFYGKSLAAEAGINLLAVEFWTPSDARHRLRHLLQLSGAPPASREAMDLLLRLAGRGALAASPRNLTAQAIIADPGAFRQVLDRVAQTGIDFTGIGSPALNEVVQQWRRLMEYAGLRHSAEVGFELEALTAEAPPVLGACLCLGFSGQHWNWAPQIFATLQASAHATVGLSAPDEQGEEADQLWISTLEERFGSYGILEEEDETKPTQETPEMLLAADVSSEARTIAAQVVEWMAQDEEARIGVAVPPGSDLGMLVTRELHALDLPVHSRFGHRRPGMLEDEGWQAWLKFLAEPGLATLVEVLEMLDEAVLKALADAGPESRFHAGEAIAALEKAYQNVLTDDFNVLLAWMGKSTGQRARMTVALMHRLHCLPERGNLQQLWDRMADAARMLGWNERVELLAPRAGQLLDQEADLELTSVDFVGWLLELSNSLEFHRLPETAHYYSRVHVLSPREAAAQAWTHLILAGQTEGEWPPPRKPETYLFRRQTAALEARLREQMRTRVREGGQGSGHEVLPPGLAWYREAGAEGQEARRDFESLSQQCRERGTVLAVSAHLGHEATPSLPLQPGEFFVRAYQWRASEDAEMNPVLDDKVCARILQHSSRLAERVFCGWEIPESGDRRVSIAAMQEAYRQRRSGDGFSAYEFALQPGATPPKSLGLSCREWEQVLRKPASQFLQHVLGVGPSPEFTLESFYARSRGTWVHEWLGAMMPLAEGERREELPMLQPLPEASVLQQRLRARAEHFREEISAACTAASRPRSVQWQSMWEEALGLAIALAGEIGSLDDYTHASTEWQVKERPLPLPDGSRLWLRGRFDGLFGMAEDWRKSKRLLVVDYKTGGRDDWKISNMKRSASGVQMALYALLLSMMSKGEVEAAQASPAFGVGARQNCRELLDWSDAWQELARMQDTACFGWRLPVRDDYGATEEMPLATLLWPDEIGQAKWAKEHPAWGDLK